MPRGQGAGPNTGQPKSPFPSIIYEDEIDKGIIYEDEIPMSPPARSVGAGVQPEITPRQRPENLPKPLSSTIADTVLDYGGSLLKGAIRVPEAMVGIADIPTRGHVGEMLDFFGYKPAEARKIIDSYASEDLQASRGAFSKAQGIGGKLSALSQNPSLIPHAVAESLPSMLGGMGVARGAMSVLPKLSAGIATGLGEGAMGAGSMASELRAENPDKLLPYWQGATATLSGGATAGLGVLGTKIAKSLGVADVDALLTKAATSPELKTTLTKQILKGAVSESLLEELPQSVQEQVADNLAHGKEINEGIADAAIMGAITGAAMGGGAQVYQHATRKPEAAPGKVDLTQPVTPPTAPPVNPVGAVPVPFTPSAITIKVGPKQNMTIATLAGKGFRIAGTDELGNVKMLPPTPPAAPAQDFGIPQEGMAGPDKAISDNRLNELTQQFAEGTTNREIPHDKIGEQKWQDLLLKVGGTQQDILGEQGITPTPSKMGQETNEVLRQARKLTKTPDPNEPAFSRAPETLLDKMEKGKIAVIEDTSPGWEGYGENGESYPNYATAVRSGEFNQLGLSHGMLTPESKAKMEAEGWKFVNRSEIADDQSTDIPDVASIRKPQDEDEISTLLDNVVESQRNDIEDNPDVSFQRILSTHPHLRAEAERIYNEKDAETISRNYLELQKKGEAFDEIYFGEGGQVMSPEHEETIELQALAYAKYERAVTRVLEGNMEFSRDPNQAVDESGAPIETREFTPDELAARKKQIATDWYRARTQARAFGIDDRKYRSLSALQEAIAEVVDKPQTVEEQTGMDLGDRKDILRTVRNSYSEGADVTAPKELLQNALDATKGMGAKGEVTINIDQRNSTFEMIDNGPGLLPADFKEVYMKLTASGKRDSGISYIGEMGVGKVTYLIGGESVEVVTIAKDPKTGKAYITKLSGTAEEILEKTAKLTMTEARNPDVETGTTVKVQFEKGNNLESSVEFIDKFLQYSSYEPNIETNVKWHNKDKSGNYPDKKRNHPPKPYKPLKVLGQGEIPGSTKYKISIPTDASTVEDSWIKVILNNRGMFQGMQEIYLGKKVEIPSRILIELDPQVSATSKSYPLTAPTRQSLEPRVKKEIEAWIEKNIIDKSQQEYIKEAGRIYDTMTKNVSASGDYVFLDDGQRLTPKELDLFKNSGDLHILGNYFEEMVAELMLAAPSKKILGPPKHIGYLMGEKTGGVNIKNPKSPDFTILLNPFELALNEDRSGLISPQVFSETLVHVIMHEFTHLGAREEGAGFTWFLKEMYGRYPLDAQIKFANRIRDGITDLRGDFTPEFRELLRVYFESRGRKPTTKDSLLGKKDIGSFAESQGPFFIRTGGATGGGKVFNRVAVKYEKIGKNKGEKKELVKAWRDAGFQSTGFRDSKGNPIYERTETQTGSRLAELWNLSRGLMSVDIPFLTSAALRQGATAVLVDPGGWARAWGNAARAYGSKTASEMIKDEISNHEYFHRKIGKDKKGNDIELPSYAEEVGLPLTDTSSITKREEQIKSMWAEKVPIWGRHVASSNRAYTAFLNTVRASSLIKFTDQARQDAVVLGDPTKDPTVNLEFGKEIATAIGVLTGRGPVELELVPGTRWTRQRKLSAEESVDKLANVFFSPKLQASRAKMLNPNTYITASPIVRKMYIRGLLSLLAVWGTIAGLAKLTGIGDIEMDPDSSDFGKIRVGNTRLDPGAGFQQFLVLMHRHFSEEFKSSTSGEEARPMRVGFRPITPGEVTQNFIASKLHPSAKFIYDYEFADDDKPFYVGDRTLQMFTPMFTSDLNEIIGEDPMSLPAILAIGASMTAGSVGMGAQTYEGGENKPSLTPLFQRQTGIPFADKDIRIPASQSDR